MTRVALGVVLVVLMAGVAQAEQAQAEQAQQQSANCTVEEINLQMVERDRKADERKIAALGAQLQDAYKRITELEKKVAESKPKDEKKGE